MVEAQNIQIFDRALRRHRQIRVAAQNEQHRFLADWADEQILDRLNDITREFSRALHFGGNTLKHPKIGNGFTMGRDFMAEEDFLPVGMHSLDLITSTLNLHAVNDLPGALIQIRNALKPDGLFIAALFGGETLHELRESLMQAEISLMGGASPRVFPFADKPQMGALLQRAGFALPVVDSEIITVTYSDMFALMQDLRGMGESNIIADRRKTNPGKNFFGEAARYYHEHFSEPDGRIRASFEIIFLIGWAPHASQQKPLQPGSAKINLADVL